MKRFVPVLFLALTNVAMAGNPPVGAPELNPHSMAGAAALAIGVLLVLADRRRPRA